MQNELQEFLQRFFEKCNLTISFYFFVFECLKINKIYNEFIESLLKNHKSYPNFHFKNISNPF